MDVMTEKLMTFNQTQLTQQIVSHCPTCKHINTLTVKTAVSLDLLGRANRLGFQTAKCIMSDLRSTVTV